MNEMEEQIDQYLTFMLGGETFAIGILAIKEIMEYTAPTQVPMMPSHVRGVINLRGAVVPVIDMDVLFGREPAAATRRSCIVIVEIGTGEACRVVGVMVDAVNAVLEIPASSIEPPPSFGARIRSDFIRGMGKVEGRFVVILDVDQVITVEDPLAAVPAPESQQQPLDALTA